MLRFGDGTPFPLEEGFLEVLVNAVGACTAMLTVTAQMEDRHKRARQRERELHEEERTLERFEQTVRTAATANVPEDRPRPTPAEQAYQQTIAAMQHALKHAREQLQQAVAENATEFGRGDAAQHVELAIGRFFECHVLPGSVWAWAWDARPVQPSFEATARSARFTVDYDLEHDVLWRAPIRIGALAPGIVLELPRRRWLGKPTVRATLLDRLVLVAARCDLEGWQLELRGRAGASSGWRITLPREGDANATALDRRGREIASFPIAMSQLAVLIEAIDLQLGARLCARHARTVMLDGVPVSQIEDTTTAARALLDTIGPIVREIRTRSRVPGELSLKRDVTAGVREEIFVSRERLAACYASLPPQYRHLLDAIGVGRGMTEVQSEFTTEVTGEIQPRPTPRPTPSTISQRATAPSVPIPSSVPIPRRSSTHTPTMPVRSLRAIPIQRATSAPMP